MAFNCLRRVCYLTQIRRFPQTRLLAANDLGYLSGQLNNIIHTDKPLHNEPQQTSSSGKDINSIKAGFDNYEEGIKNFQLDVPEYFNFAKDVIDFWADLEEKELEAGEEPGQMKHLGLWWADDNGRQYKWTYSQLSTLTKRMAYVLTGPCALERGDRLVAMMTSFPQYWLLYLASVRAGITFCPASPDHSPEEIKLRLVKSKAYCIVTDHAQLDKIDLIAEECPHLRTKVFMPGSRAIHRKSGWFNYADMYKTSNKLHMECEHTRSDETMVIFFTTGTTGEPKLVEHTHASYGVASIINGKYWYDQTREDMMWTFADAGWAKLAWGILGAWRQGACVFAYHFNYPGAFTYECFKPERALKILEDFPITTFTTSPPMWRKLVQEDLDMYKFEHLRHAFSGGELLSPEVIEKWYNGTGLGLYDGFGQTENSVLCAHFKCIPMKEGSIGRPAPGYNLTVIDDEGQEVPTLQHGHIAIKVKPERPTGLFTGYLFATEDDPVRTATNYVGDYYLTGDMGYVDADGYFWFVSRKSDLIYTAGHTVSPFDVEVAIMEHASVAECAVVSSPDHLQLTGQVVKAFVVLSEDYVDLDREEVLGALHQHCLDYLESYKVPQQIEFVPSLPTTVTGKLKRADLRRQEWQHHGNH